MAPSITEKVPLLGADGYFALINQTDSVGEQYDLHPYRCATRSTGMAR